MDRSVSAEEPSLPLIPQSIRWLKGPAHPALGNVGDLNLPEGFRFVDGQGARTILESMKSAVPEGFVGLISPNSGEWALTLAYSQSGHAQDTDWQKLDTDRLLKSIWERTAELNHDRTKQGLPAVTHVNWAMKPEYDGKLHLVQWAVVQDGNLDKDRSVAYTGRVLGRHGVIEAKAIRRESADLFPVKELVKKISFKSGEQYADFQKGERIAEGGITGVIAAQNQNALAGNRHTAQGAGATVFWIGLGAIAIVGLVGASFLAKKLRSEKAPNPAATVASPAERPVVHANGSSAPRLNLKPALARPALNGANGSHRTNGHAKTNGNLNGNAKKRRIFNYEKFYTEMMLQGPAPVIGEPYAGFNGYNNGSPEANGTNGANGHNGYDLDHKQNGHNGLSNSKAPASDSNLLSAHADIIASQRSLIEDQKRLIQEQARLIEEKSKLITEKNTLLDRQSQMLDSNLL